MKPPLSLVLFLFLAVAGWLTPVRAAFGQTPQPSPSAAAPVLEDKTPTPVPMPHGPPVPVIRSYVIQDDDTLWDLSGAFYGRPSLWPLFLKFNSIPNPDLIFPGQALLFPDLEVLMKIQEKTPEEVKDIRESMVKQAAPVTVTSLPSAPVTAKASKPVTEELAKATPNPTPLKTPTFKITGSKTINISYSEAVGNSVNGFTNTGYDRHETLRLQLEGQLNDEVKILGHFAQSDLALQDDYDLTLSTKHWELFFGNFPAALPGSQYLSSGLSTTGLKATGKYDNWDVTAFYATPQGRPVYEKFFGNNTQGPFVIPDLPLVPGSEIIWLNKQKLTRGVDYTLDYTLGYLTFLTRIIQLTDLIEIQAVASSAVFNTQLYGYRAEVALIGKVHPPASPGAGTVGSRPSLGSAGVTGMAGALGLLGNPLAGGATSVPGSAGLTQTLEAGGNTTAAVTLSAGTTQAAPGSASKAFSGPSWTIGQGYLRQFEQPDADITTGTGRAAADTHMIEMDTTLDFGPSLKLSGEADGSLFLSSNTAVTPSKEGAAYRAQGDTYQGPLHLQGKISGSTPNFVNIGNPLASNDFLEWTLLGDYKAGDRFFAQADRTFQRNFVSGPEDDTTTDHGEAKIKPKNFPEIDYVYYQSAEQRLDPATPFQQQDLRNTASVVFGLPASISGKVSALQESQSGTSLGENDSFGGRVEIATQKWKVFNFSASGEWRLNNIVESGSNTLVPVATPGNNILSQTYTFTMEGKPVTHLTLTGKGTYSDAPPGPTRANVTQTFQTDPFLWLKANGTYSLDFQQTQAQGVSTPDQVHTGSGNLELNPLKWLKLTAQPSFRLDLLPQYGDQALSENWHQNYKANLTPSFGSLNGDYTYDQFWTWDGTTAGFPLNFQQETQTINVSGKKPLGKLSLEASYKRTDQDQQTLSAGTTTISDTLNQTQTDSLSWNANKVFTFTASYAYNQLNQSSPGQGNLANPLLPNGADTFNSSFSLTTQNAFTYSHTFTGRVTEQMTKTFSVYEEGGYTHTVDVLQNGTVETYSPAAGFTWKPGSFLSWTASYQYNGSSGEVDTTIQKAQTTLSASLNPAAILSVTWNWSRADNPFVQNQQGNISYTMNF